MIDVNEILKNETIKNLLNKTGVSEKQANDIIKQAINLIGDKFKEQPKQMSSLLSTKPNTEEDNKLSKNIENEFSNKLSSNLGISSEKAKSIQSTMPHIVQSVSKKMSDKGVNSQNGFDSFFKTAETFISKKENQTMIIGAAKSIFGSFFSKKK